MSFRGILDGFFEHAARNRIEIYNEFALQFELAFYLRATLENDYKVQLERNIGFLNFRKSDFMKKELDLIIFRDIGRLDDVVVVELKAIIGQKIARPINIFHWVEDLKFLEQLRAAGVGQCLSVFVTNHAQLLAAPDGRSNTTLPLLPDFRSRRVRGTYSTHAASHEKNRSVTLAAGHSFDWRDYIDGQKYFIVDV